MTCRNLMGWMLCVAVTGCATTGKFETSEALSEQQRRQLGRVLIVPHADVSATTSGITDGKGEGAAKGAGGATAAMWSGIGSASGGDGSEALMLIALVALTPVVAAGGAIYGAAAADSAADVERFEATLSQVFASSESAYMRALEDRVDALGAGQVLVADDIELPHDSRLEVDFVALEGAGGGVKSNLKFTLRAQSRLYTTDRAIPTYTRSYASSTSVRELSDWAADDGVELTRAIQEMAMRTVDAMLDDHFRAPALRIQPVYPAFGHAFKPRRLDTAQPQIDWRLWDGRMAAADAGLVDVSYQLRLTSSEGDRIERQLQGVSEFRPDRPLATCATYQWQVRASYESFGSARSTEWTQPHRFRTPCPRG